MKLIIIEVEDNLPEEKMTELFHGISAVTKAYTEGHIAHVRVGTVHLNL